jgi:transaldolase / glucose-6-phosphate isomerase
MTKQSLNLMSMLTPSLGKYQSQVDVTLSSMSSNRIASRIWAHDHTVWADSPDEITNRLGWLDCPQNMAAEAAGLANFAAEIQAEGFTHVLLLGMGGSSLAPEVFSKIFAGQTALILYILDSTYPAYVLEYTRTLDPAHTLYVVSTKSGGTVETLSFFKHFFNHAIDTLGLEKARQHFIAITDPGSGLETLMRANQIRRIFLNDPNIGGRYSALSHFGLVPAALLGIDLPQLIACSQDMVKACQLPGIDNPGLALGAILGELAKAGRDKVTFLTSPSLESFGDWAEQLIAESTGKAGKGIVPVVGENLADPTAYGDDRLFLSLTLAGEPAPDLSALEATGHPILHLTLNDRNDLGGQYFLWEFATAVAGHLLEIPPFDQPNVEAAKILARKMMAEYKEKGQLPEGETSPLTGDVLLEFLSRARAGDYISLQAYVHPTRDAASALQTLRHKLRERTALATTLGFGPRFLHSTGQLHKGDAGNGRFIQFTSDSPEDVPIPDEAGKSHSSLTFGTLIHAQALGDYEALSTTTPPRRIIHFHLGRDVVGGLEKLISVL